MARGSALGSGTTSVLGDAPPRYFDELVEIDRQRARIVLAYCAFLDPAFYGLDLVVYPAEILAHPKSAFLQKPFRMDRLAAKLREMLGD